MQSVGRGSAATVSLCQSRPSVSFPHLGSVSDYADTSSLQQSVATIATVDASAVVINVAAASVRITAFIAVPASTTAAALQSLLSTSLSSAFAASKQLGINVLEMPTVQIASPPSMPPTLSPSSPPGEDDTSSQRKNANPQGGGGDITIWALTGSGLVFIALAVACYVCQKRKGLPHTTEIDPTLVASANGSSDFQADAANPPALAHTVVYHVPCKGLLLDGTAHMRTGLSWYVPIKVQLLAVPQPDGELDLDAHEDAPAWSALKMGGVTVPYDEVVSVRMVESALELIVKHRPRDPHGSHDPPAPKHLRMHSRPEFDLWRDALLKPQTGSKASQISAAQKWLSKDVEASALGLLESDLVSGGSWGEPEESRWI